MKFAYIDESGSTDEGDIFVMAGLLVDAYRLRKHTEAFDRVLTDFLSRHPDGLRRELKTKRMINGEGGWSGVDAKERKKFLGDVCDLTKEFARIFAIAVSFKKFAAT